MGSVPFIGRMQGAVSFSGFQLKGTDPLITKADAVNCAAWHKRWA